MTNIKAKITGSIIAGSIIAAGLLPASAFASTSVTISGNAQNSNNGVVLVTKNKVKTTQTNTTSVHNLVGVLQNTGGNKASHNNGSDVTVSSGSSTSTVTNTTTTGYNVAVVPSCGCSQSGDTTVDISGNAEHSNNGVVIVNISKSTVTQTNTTHVVNGVLVVENTGGNQASHNNGGSVDVGSGDASSTVTNTTTTGGNVVTPTP